MERIQHHQLQESPPVMPQIRHHLSPWVWEDQSHRWDLGCPESQSSTSTVGYFLPFLHFKSSVSLGLWCFIKSVSQCQLFFERGIFIPLWMSCRGGYLAGCTVAKVFPSWNSNKYFRLFFRSSLVLLKLTALITEYLLRLWWLSHWYNKQRNRNIPSWKIFLLCFLWHDWLELAPQMQLGFWLPLTNQASCCIKSLHWPFMKVY